MTRRRSSGSSIVPSGASRRAWSWPRPRIPGRRSTSARARATAGPGATAQAPPAASARSGAGAPSIQGVAASSRTTAARTAASRSSAPSPAASPHGETASSRSRSRTRSRSSGIVSQPEIASRCASPNPRGSSAASATTADVTVGPPGPGAAWTRIPAAWPISTTSSRRPRTSASVPIATAERPPPVALAATQRAEQLPERRAAAGRRATGRGRSRRAGRAGSPPRTVPPGVASPPASTIDEVRPALGRRGHERRELGEQRPLVAAGRVARAREHGREPRVRERRGRRRGCRRRRAIDPVDAPAGRRPRPRRAARDPLGRREDGELGRGGGLARDAGQPVERRADRRARASRASSGSASTRRRRRRSRTASGVDRRPAPAVEPRSRQCARRPGRRARRRRSPSRDRPRRRPGVRCSPGRCYQRGRRPPGRAVRRPSRRTRPAPRAGR